MEKLGNVLTEKHKVNLIVSNKIKNLVLILFVLMLFKTTHSEAQCSSEDFMDKCSSALDEFNYIKSYELENKKGAKTEYSYVFSKGSMYRIVICDGNIEDNRLVVTLYDRNRKKIVSNYDKRSKKYYPTINYPCSATGVYYVEYEFEGSKIKCAVNILGFSKK